MALKKSELYSSLWSSCDELRGGMDASQYKDYVLVLLFIKYVSAKYAGVPYAPITIPKGSSFQDMVALKGKSDIGDQINKKIIAPLANANKLSDMPDFNDATKLGSGKEIVDRLTNPPPTFSVAIGATPAKPKKLEGQCSALGRLSLEVLVLLPRPERSWQPSTRTCFGPHPTGPENPLNRIAAPFP
jgi:hypothetical protein